MNSNEVHFDRKEVVPDDLKLKKALGDTYLAYREILALVETFLWGENRMATQDFAKGKGALLSHAAGWFISAGICGAGEGERDVAEFEIAGEYERVVGSSEEVS
jgi:hypothetical protein